MPLSPGVRLGVYQVSALIGEGGMGQAIRPLYAGGADPGLAEPSNIAHVQGLEESSGVRALVIELVEGENHPSSELEAAGDVTASWYHPGASIVA